MRTSKRQPFAYLVLISTYWNVNPPARAENRPLRSVLISTYWNVNLKFAWTACATLFRFNLNLLECKLC